MNRRVAIVIGVIVAAVVALVWWLDGDEGGEARRLPIPEASPRVEKVPAKNSGERLPGDVPPAPDIADTKPEPIVALVAPAPPVPNPDVYLVFTLPEGAEESAIRLRVMPMDTPFGKSPNSTPDIANVHRSRLSRRADGSYGKNPETSRFDMPGSIDFSEVVSPSKPARFGVTVGEHGVRITVCGPGFQSRVGWVVPSGEGAFKVPAHREDYNDPLHYCIFPASNRVLGEADSADFLPPATSKRGGVLEFSLLPWVGMSIEFVDASDRPLAMPWLEITLHGQSSGFVHSFVRGVSMELPTRKAGARIETKWTSGVTLSARVRGSDSDAEIEVTPPLVVLAAGKPERMVVKDRRTHRRSIRVVNIEGAPLDRAMAITIPGQGSFTAAPSGPDGVVTGSATGGVTRLVVFAPGYSPGVGDLPVKAEDDPVDVKLEKAEGEDSTLTIDWGGQTPADDTLVAVLWMWSIPLEFIDPASRRNFSLPTFRWTETLGPRSELRIPYARATMTPSAHLHAFVNAVPRKEQVRGVNVWRAEPASALVRVELVNPDGSPADENSPRPISQQMEWQATLQAVDPAKIVDTLSSRGQTVRDSFRVVSRDSDKPARVPVGRYWLRVLAEGGVKGSYEQQVDLVAGDQTIKVLLGEPLTWETYRIVDETGRCDQPGAVFFSAPVDLSIAARAATQVRGNVKRYSEMLSKYAESVEEGTQMYNNFLTAARKVMLARLEYGEPAAVAVVNQGEVELPQFVSADWHVIPSQGTGMFGTRVDTVGKTIRIVPTMRAAQVVVVPPSDWRAKAQSVRDAQLEKMRKYPAIHGAPADLAGIEAEAAESLPWTLLALRNKDSEASRVEPTFLSVSMADGEYRLSDLPPGKYSVFWCRWVYFMRDGKQESKLMLSSHEVEFEVAAMDTKTIAVPIEMR